MGSSLPFFLLLLSLPFLFCSQYDYYHAIHPGEGCQGKGSLYVNNKDDRLYGWTGSGGEHQAGSGFKITKDLVTFETLLSYEKGTTGYNPHHGTFIMNDEGLLLGTTTKGVREGVWGGVVYSIDPKKQDYTTKFQFGNNLTGSLNGTNLVNGLTLGPDKKFYGVTASGGLFWDSCSSQGIGGGTLFSLSNDGSDFKLITSFGVPLDEQSRKCDCFSSSGAPTFGINGTHVYMAFRYGGAHSMGGVLSVNIFTGEQKALVYFDESTGHTPWNPTLLYDKGKLYGTTSKGGFGNQGTIFSIKEDGSDFTILHSFCPDNSCLAGKKPHDGVIKGEDGKLYGMTRGGGTNDWGVLYRVGVDGKDFEVLREFDQAEGGKPVGLLTSSDGTLYGILQQGGEHTCGAVFGLKYPIAPVSPSSHSDTAVVLVSLFGGFSLILISIVICLRFERQRFCCV